MEKLYYGGAESVQKKLSNIKRGLKTFVRLQKKMVRSKGYKKYMYFSYGNSAQGYEQRYYNPVFRRGVVRIEKP